MGRQWFAAGHAKRKARAARFDGMSDSERLACIPHPSLPHSEFEVHAYVYGELRRLGHVVRGEVASLCGTCKFDLVVYVDHLPVLIIEVKRGPSAAPDAGTRKRVREAGRRQVARYAKFGVRVLTISGFKSAIEYIAQVERFKTV